MWHLLRDKRNAYRFVMGKSEVKIPRGRARRKGKGKAVPLQVQRGPEGSRKLRFRDKFTGWW
jgi:hypothetical protein